MIRARKVLVWLLALLLLAVAGVAKEKDVGHAEIYHSWIGVGRAAADLFTPYVANGAASWAINNVTGVGITGLHIEFNQDVTITSKLEVGGLLPLIGASTGTVFDFAGGSLVAGGTVILAWEPADAVPSFIAWMNGEQAAGTPYFTTLAQLGDLLGAGIVTARETNPEALMAAFDQFFLDNAEFLEGLTESLGMSLADSLMPIIMAAPAEGITNFFNTIVGMLGVTTLEGVMEGDLDWGALFALLGL